MVPISFLSPLFSPSIFFFKNLFFPYHGFSFCLAFFFIGLLPTVPSQFEVGSSSAAIPNPANDVATFFACFDQLEVNDLGSADFWASGPPYVDFYGFRVLEDCIFHLVMIYSSHGNFMQEFRLGRFAREHFLKMLGCVLNDIEHNFIDFVSVERIL